ncbi:hypothetical protein FACS1894211_06470 [Clostridia bacterium]|nr:hypothetical protein FACS1894211_06470 [Clostridia bacterium]
MKKKLLLSVILVCIMAMSMGLLAACGEGTTGKIEDTQFTVTYDLDGGTGEFPALKVKYGDDLTLPATEPTKAGYVFDGWEIAADGKLTTDVKVVAKWLTEAQYDLKLIADSIAQDDKPNTPRFQTQEFTVFFDFNGGDGTGLAHTHANTVINVNHSEAHEFETKQVTATSYATILPPTQPGSTSFTIVQGPWQLDISEDATIATDGICIPTRPGYNFTGWAFGAHTGTPVLITGADIYQMTIPYGLIEPAGFNPGAINDTSSYSGKIPVYGNGNGILPISPIFYAQWEEIPNPDEVTVTIIRDYPVLNGGPDTRYDVPGYTYVDNYILSRFTLNAGDLIPMPGYNNLPGGFLVTGYSVNRIDEQGYVNWDFNTPITQDTTLYLVYKPGGEAYIADFYAHDTATEDNGICDHDADPLLQPWNILNTNPVYGEHNIENPTVNYNLLVVPKGTSVAQEYMYVTGSTTTPITPAGTTIWKEYDGAATPTHTSYAIFGLIAGNVELHAGNRIVTPDSDKKQIRWIEDSLDFSTASSDFFTISPNGSFGTSAQGIFYQNYYLPTDWIDKYEPTTYSVPFSGTYAGTVYGFDYWTTDPNVPTPVDFFDPMNPRLVSDLLTAGGILYAVYKPRVISEPEVTKIEWIEDYLQYNTGDGTYWTKHPNGIFGAQPDGLFYVGTYLSTDTISITDPGPNVVTPWGGSFSGQSYTFLFWTLNPAASSPVDFFYPLTTRPVTDVIGGKLYAVYKVEVPVPARVLVTYYQDNLTDWNCANGFNPTAWATIFVVYGGHVAEANPPAGEFIYWSLNQNATIASQATDEYKFAGSVSVLPVTSNISLYAVYKPNSAEGEKWCVSFIEDSEDYNTADGDYYSLSQYTQDNLLLATNGLFFKDAVPAGVAVVNPGNPAVGNGYTFAFWALDPSVPIAYDFASPVTSHIALYAVYATELPPELKKIPYMELDGKGNLVATVDANGSQDFTYYNGYSRLFTVETSGTYTLTLSRTSLTDVLAKVYNIEDTSVVIDELTDGDMDYYSNAAQGILTLSLTAGEIYMVTLPLNTTVGWPYPTNAGDVVTITVALAE